MANPDPREFTAFLESLVTPERRARMLKALSARTDRIRLVLEDVFQPQNASACLRTADLFGLQHIHIIEERHRFELNPDVTRGSTQWLDLHRYNDRSGGNTTRCLHELRDLGYRIVATIPQPDAVPLPELPVDAPLALCFGTEWGGLSPELRAAADVTVVIPMYGMTESYNLSVSVALCLYELTGRLRRTTDNWALAPAERERIYGEWLRRSVRHPDRIERDFHAQRQGLRQTSSPDLRPL